MPQASTRLSPADTKTRILDAAETLFVSGGFESMSMRQITSAANVNLAAVNYHFGSKDALIQAVLSRRLDPLNEQRVAMLDAFESNLGDKLTCEHILVALFLPAVRIFRSDAPMADRYLHFLGRAYTDPSPVVRDFINTHYIQTLGQAFAKAVGDKKGIRRYGHAYVPLDEALSRVVIDFSGRPGLHIHLPFTSGSIGGFDTQLTYEFFQGFVNHAGVTVHIDNLKGANAHHQCETVFKAFARALRAALERDPRMAGVIPSTKGSL